MDSGVYVDDAIYVISCSREDIEGSLCGEYCAEFVDSGLGYEVCDCDWLYLYVGWILYKRSGINGLG